MNKEDFYKEAINYLKEAKPVTKTFTKVNVDYVEETGTLYVDDYDTDEQLAVFYVSEEKE